MNTQQDSTATTATAPTATAEPVRISKRTGKPVRTLYGKQQKRHLAAQLIQDARNMKRFGTTEPTDTMADALPVELYNPNEPGDFLLIPQKSRARCLDFLAALIRCRRWHEAQTAACVQFWEIEQAKRSSALYKSALDTITNQLLADRVRDIETAVAADAAGEAPEEGRRRPDTKAAALFLAANDPRYKQSSQNAAATVILDVKL